MAEKKGRALLMVFVDMDPENLPDFNAWYNEEHVPELLELPGFLNAARYEALSGGPRYLACYELDKYLTVYEFEHEKAPETQAWRTRRAQDQMHDYIGGSYGHAPGSPGVYRRILPPRAF